MKSELERIGLEVDALLKRLRYENHQSFHCTALIFGCSALFCVAVSFALYFLFSRVLSVPEQRASLSPVIELFVAPIVEQLMIVSVLALLSYFKQAPRVTLVNAAICALIFALLHFELQGGLLRSIVIMGGSTVAFYCWLSVLPFGFRKTFFWSSYMHILNNSLVEIGATALEK